MTSDNSEKMKQSCGKLISNQGLVADRKWKLYCKQIPNQSVICYSPRNWAIGSCWVTECNFKSEIYIMVQPQKTPLRCDQCVKYLPTKSDLRKHLRQHTGEKPFLCTECNKCFSQLSHLRRHERVHTGEKRFKCYQCGKSFTQGEGLKLHTRIHTGEKPFTC